MSVNPDQDQHRRNRLLSALRPRDYALLEPHLQIVPIGEGEFLHLPGDEIEQVYFLHKGIVSLMAISVEGGRNRHGKRGKRGSYRYDCRHWLRAFRHASVGPRAGGRLTN